MMIGCSKTTPPPEEFVNRQFWYEDMAVTNVEFVSKSGNNMYFDLHTVAMKNGEFGYYYPDTAFKEVYFTNGNFTVKPDSVYFKEYQENRGYQTIILIEQSVERFASYTGPALVDALNRINKVSDVNIGQYFGIGYFARDEVHGESPAHFFKNENNQSLFEHSEQDIMKFNSEGYTTLGKADASSLYDAIDKAMDHIIANPLSPNRSVTVLMSNYDDGLSSVTPAGLIQKGLINDIKINIIFYENGYYGHIRMATETGGFVSSSNAISLLSPVFHLHDLLRGNYKEYVIRCKATRNGSWPTGYIVNGYIDVLYQEEIKGQYFEDDLYDDLDIDQLLPFVFKVL
jgi:hypothetical protein